LELGDVDAAAGAAGIDQPAVRIVIGEQQGAEIGPAFLPVRSVSTEICEIVPFILNCTYDLAIEHELCEFRNLRGH
jgi:hypothetical protein